MTKAIKQSAIAAAVALTVGDHSYTAAEVAMHTAIHAYGVAMACSAEQATSEWDLYVTAISLGATAANISDGARDVLVAEAAGNLTDDEVADMVSTMRNRTRQYAHRVKLLQEKGVALVDEHGCPVEGLATMARKLQEANAGQKRGTQKRTTRGNSANATGDDNSKPSDALNTTTPDNVAITESLVSRVLAALQGDSEEAAALRRAFAAQVDGVAKLTHREALAIKAADAARAKAKDAKAAAKKAEHAANRAAVKAEAQQQAATAQ